ncbi:Na/Pi symporter [Metabacillus indicus]|uniref:Na/Pi symporter n=1 Tax=Metabacillus indicus TaxID=246786 RepID=UPI002490B43F|nr:Na/Pi symporter [Metabacillus indicus]MDX8292087.1 Na/Pi symporter [Metabacillus indicus]
MAAAGFFLLYLLFFLTGMQILKNGLSILSGSTMRSWVFACIDHPFKAFLAGIVFTGILQSSSAVMVIVIGLVSAGVITFRQTIGIILGTNIGSTFTTQLITLDLGSLIIPMIGGGFVFFLAGAMMKRQSLLRISGILSGLGLLFLSMSGFGKLAEPLSHLETVSELLLYSNTHAFAGVLGGTVLTAIIHSSAAAAGIIMSFMNADLLTLSAGIAYILGANIGTCITGLMASAGAGHEAKLTAYAHVWLNVLGVAAFYPFIAFCSGIAEHFAAEPDLQLAHFSLVFNVVSSIAVLPFAEPFGRFVESSARFVNRKH